jgi:hypothetical protein
VIPGILGTILFVFYVTALLLMYYMRARFAHFRYEVFGIVANGAIGVVGFVLYASNLPIVGTTTPLLHLYSDCVATQRCDTQWLLIVYSLLSTIRFLCWYAEFLTSFLFIAVFSDFPLFMALLRYGFHMLNLILSCCTLGLSYRLDFPSQEVLGGTTVRPSIIQALFAAFVVLSFYFIARSDLYRVAWRNGRTSVRVRGAVTTST